MEGMRTLVVLVLALVLGICAVCAWREDGYRDGYLLQTALHKRSSINCRRCLNRPSDWYRCRGCYTRRSVPYGGSAKRSPYLDYTGSDVMDVQKRGSFMDCRCCESLRRRDCCARCNLVELEEQAVDQCDICCDSQTFDFYCCMECNRR